MLHVGVLERSSNLGASSINRLLQGLAWLILLRVVAKSLTATGVHFFSTNGPKIGCLDAEWEVWRWKVCCDVGVVVKM